ncbi:hypothetical protein [Pseudomonas mucidolens]|uniref:Uncharacterized protein n=1 Tax=Pseudomonas mucidolens TaxID=46679 RepID=A0A1H2MEC2_9PSED|nr:hypothetical protein [Pseudomonas mucidolens]SDU91580.1 hypothetical protein SAMN05216202_1562 [Pseudomonas mucidolens]SQH34024.1 Uncharacterised protein [Pseudomonas mucidolens]
MNTPEQLRSNAASAIKLEADKPTGEQPMELFITDEHTEYYLALKAGGIRIEEWVEPEKQGMGTR